LAYFATDPSGKQAIPLSNYKKFGLINKPFLIKQCGQTFAGFTRGLSGGEGIDMADQTRKESRTSTLLRRLFNAQDLETFMDCHASELDLPPFHTYITQLCETTGQVPEQVIKRAGIERTYGHQLFNGTRKPSRDKVLQLAFGFQLTLECTHRLLQIAQKSPLYPKIKRDAAILFCIQHRKDVIETQCVLESLGLTLLGGD
jgi:hypothetical protein